MAQQICYLDKIRIRTEDGQYVRHDGKDRPFDFTSSVESASQFTLKEYNPGTNSGFCYSGNLDADTVDAYMNFRLVCEDMDADFNVTSVNVGNRAFEGLNALYLGVDWGAANDYETFLAFDPDYIESTGAILDGSKIKIRNMRGSASNGLAMFWREWGQRFTGLGIRDPQREMIYQNMITKTNVDLSSERLFITTTQLDGWTGPNLGAYGAGPDCASVYIIEKV